MTYVNLFVLLIFLLYYLNDPMVTFPMILLRKIRKIIKIGSITIIEPATCIGGQLDPLTVLAPNLYIP